MGKNTSITLGEHFEGFVKFKIDEGRYKNASEVIQAGLRLLEIEEQKYHALKTAIKEGVESGIVENFDAKEHLRQLELKRSKNA